MMSPGANFWTEAQDQASRPEESVQSDQVAKIGDNVRANPLRTATLRRRVTQALKSIALKLQEYCAIEEWQRRSTTM